ncbi:MAG: hypothetical protein ACFFDN_11195 [Candidatus Hodarchaeota archaeon]
MRNLKNYICSLLIVILAVLLFYNRCSKNENPTEPTFEPGPGEVLGEISLPSGSSISLTSLKVQSYKG